MTDNEIGTIIIDTAIAIHRELGPGLLESVYEVVLCQELQGRGLEVVRQAAIPIRYKSMTFAEGFRADLLVQRRVIVELKSVDHVAAAHKKQVQTHIRLAGLKLGYLLNFGDALMKAGISRCVNGMAEEIPPELEMRPG